MGKCHFQDSWLKKTDSADHLISSWAKKHGDSELFCTVCCTIVSATKGFQAVVQHYNSTKHKENAKVKLEPLQLHLSAVNPTSSTSTAGRPTGSLQLYAVKDSAIIAELIWAMKTVSCNFSAASCHGIRETFAAMFPGCIPQGFSLSPKKISYLISDALAPYFRKQMIEDAQSAFYVLSYDETTNSAGRKELQTQIRYWSNSKQEIVSQHLETFFLGKATGKVLFTNICTALDNANLCHKNLITLCSDGPNVNKTVFRLMNEEMLKVRKIGLLDVGTCTIHVIHNAFQKGLEQLGNDASELVLLVYYFFKGWPVRLENFTKIQNELGLPAHHFIKHVSSRWLTLEPAASRLLEQWDAVVMYFLVHVPKSYSHLVSTNKYKQIKSLLKLPTMKAELHFVAGSAHIFTQFTGVFQKSEPLVHMLYNSLKKLAQTLMGRVCTQEALMKNVLMSSTLDNSQNLLPIKQVMCNDAVEQELAQVTERDQISFRKQAQKHYVSACQHLLHKTQIGSKQLPVLKYFQCLNTGERKSEKSWRDIVKLAQAVPVSVPTDTVLDEWKLLQLEEEPPRRQIEPNELRNVDDAVLGENEYVRIDHYWQHYFSLCDDDGVPKYPTVTRLLKACMAVAHGSAEVERGFSLSGRILNDDRASMGVRTLNARLTVNDALKTYYHAKPELVSFTRELITLGHNAAKTYRNYLEGKKKMEDEERQQKKDDECRRIREEELKQKMSEDRKNIQSMEQDLKKQRNEETNKRKAGEMLFEEATERLKKALKSNNMEEVRLAQAMLEGVKTVKKDENEQKKKADLIQNRVEKRKSSIISRYFSEDGTSTCTKQNKRVSCTKQKK